MANSASGLRKTSDILETLHLFRDAKMSGSTWKELFQYLARNDSAWVPQLDDTKMYVVKDINLVSTEFQQADQEMVALL